MHHLTRAEEPEDARSIVGLLADLSQTTVDLIRDEAVLARREIADAVGNMRRGLVLLLLAATLGVVALFTLTRAATAALTRHMGEPEAALLIGLALFSVAAAAAWTGLRRLG